jgi:ADP-heptose:LPS heptosyltransferase
VKLLIIRFSSFGDIIQCLSVPAAFKNAFPEAKVDWLVRSDFADLLLGQKSIHKVWSFDRKLGVFGLLKFAWQLRKQNYTHVYDAHNNLRSHLVSLVLTGSQFLRRPKNRWKRFLLFKLGQNTFQMPFIAQRSYVEPIEPWTESVGLPLAPQLEIPHTVHQTVASVLMPMTPFVALAPSTAWPKKDWPVEHWSKLIQSLPGLNFVILGGPGDEACKILSREKPAGNGQLLNMAGRLSLLESCAVISQAQALVSADTGLLHAADQLGVPTIALIGPTAFGYPARVTSQVLEVNLPCKPCSKDGRGPCVNPIFQKCMVDISSDRVKSTLLGILAR